jgi:hypothetical protein
MGANISKTQLETINETIFETVVKVTSKTSASVGTRQDNVLDISGSHNVTLGKITMRNAAKVNMNVLAKTASTGELQREIVSKLTALFKQEQQSMAGVSYDDTTVSNTIKNVIKTNFSTENITEVVNNYKQRNKILIRGSTNVRTQSEILLENKLETLTKLIGDTTNKLVEKVGLKVSTDSTVDKKQTADVFKSLGDFFAATWFIWIIVFVILGVFVFYKLTGGGKGSFGPIAFAPMRPPPPPPPPPMQPQYSPPRGAPPPPRGAPPPARQSAALPRNQSLVVQREGDSSVSVRIPSNLANAAEQVMQSRGLVQPSYRPTYAM